MKKDFKDLRFFLNQFKVKKLYREYMKTIYQSKNIDARQELVNLVRSEFLANKNCENQQKIEVLLAAGRQKIPYIKSMIHMQS